MLGISACRNESVTAPPPAASTRPRSPIDETIARLRGSDEAEQKWKALHELQSALDATATCLAADAERAADDPDLLAWQRGLQFLDDLATAGWPVDPVARVLEARQLAAAPATDPTRSASHFEAWSTAWLLRRRVQGDEASLGELPLDALVDTDNLTRYSRGDSEPALWSLVLLAMSQREAGRTDAALEALDHAEAALAGSTGDAAWPTIAVYAQLERASCQQLLGRAAAAGRALATAHALVESWRPGDATDAVRLHRETRAAVDLARIRQACLTGRSTAAERQIAALHASEPGPGITAQLAYYESQVALHRDEPRRARALLDQALADPALVPRVRGMALLEAATLELGRRADLGSSPDPEAIARARALLTEFDELTTGRPRDDAPLLRARATALRARAARLECLDAPPDSPGRATDLAPALAAAESAFDAFLDTWKTADDGLGVGTLAFQPRRLLLDEVVELHLLTTAGSAGRERALEAGWRLRARGALASSLGAPRAPTLARVRDCLLDGHRAGLLVLLPGLETTHVFLVTRQTVEHHRGAPLERLRPSIRALWRELAATPVAEQLAASRDRAGDAADRLADRLLDSATMRNRLAELRTLGFVGADLLERLPVELLPLATDGRPIGLTHAVTVAPSTAVALVLADRTAVAAPPRLAVLTPPSPDGMSELVFPQASRATIERSCARVEWLTDDRAGIEALDRPGLDAQLLFGHGILDPSRARPRGVALAPSPALPDGRLFPDDLERLAPRTAPLVMLAVCETTSTDAQLGGDDSDHLAASFLRTGTRTVLASPCPLEQAATATLAATLLARLTDDTSVAEALRAARVELRSTSRFDHPRFWGTWSAFGN